MLTINFDENNNECKPPACAEIHQSKLALPQSRLSTTPEVQKDNPNRK